MNRRSYWAGSVAALLLAAGCGGQTYDKTLSIVFNPMYSGNDGNAHTYQIPATIDNSQVNGVMNVKWTASDNSYVDLKPDADGIGVMITTKKPGKVTIIATAGDAQGKVPLTISKYDPAAWTAGQNRYANAPKWMPMQGMRGFPNGGLYACNSCHVDGTGGFVQHTPEQTGGFTDAQLKDIFVNGNLPPSLQNALPGFPQETFKTFHHWTVTDQEADGLIAYLRSLVPMSQGDIDFGGHGGHRPDGGFHRPDGGFHRDGGMFPRPDGGMPPGMDAGMPADMKAPTADMAAPTGDMSH